MRSVVVKEPGQLNIESRPVPVPGAHEVRVKIAFAGICGSDVHIYHGHNPFAKYPRVIGHEFYGIIDAVGEQVSPARIGERVAVDPVVSCGHCYPCSVGRPNVCTQLRVIGVHRDGDLATMPACRRKMPGASPRLSATVRQRWLSLYHRGKYYRPAAAHGARYCPGLRRWPDGADNHSGAKGGIWR